MNWRKSVQRGGMISLRALEEPKSPRSGGSRPETGGFRTPARSEVGRIHIPEAAASGNVTHEFARRSPPTHEAAGARFWFEREALAGEPAAPGRMDAERI
jgi:hypothetical protein